MLKEVFIKSFDKDVKTDRSDFIGLSEIMDCDLKLYYTKLYPKYEMNGYQARGIVLEKAFLDRLIEEGTDVRNIGDDQYEYENLDAYLSGHLDAIIYEDDQPSTVLELKSTSPFKFHDKEAIRDILEKAAMQLKNYLAVTYSKLGLLKGKVIIINSDNIFDIQEFEFNFKQDELFSRRKALIARAYDIMTSVKAKVPPEPKPSKLSCKYCDYKSMCPLENVLTDFSEKKKVEVTDTQTGDAILEYRNLKAQQKKLKAQEKQIKQHLIKYVNDTEATELNYSGEKIKVSRVDRNGKSYTRLS